VRRVRSKVPDEMIYGVGQLASQYPGVHVIGIFRRAFTIGHSYSSILDFAALLRHSNVVKYALKF
jgi:hypothetical protein